MESNRGFGGTFAQMVVTLCLLVFCVVLTITLVRFNVFTLVQSAVVGSLFFLSLYVLQLQYHIRHDLKALNDSGSDTGHKSGQYEVEIARRVEEISAQLSASAEQNSIAYGGDLNTIKNTLATLDTRLWTLESAAASIVNDTNKSAGADKKSRKSRSNLNSPEPDKVSLRSAINGKNLNMHLQPIVELPTRKPAFFDAFMRLKVGDKDYLDGNKLARLVDEGGLVPVIDKKVLFSSVRMVRKLSAINKQAGIFCPVSSKTLADDSIFAEILSFLEASRDVGDFIVIEINQRDRASLKETGRNRLKQIAGLGYNLSLGQVLDLNLSVNDLADSGFGFVKVSASILLHANISADDGGIHPLGLARALEQRDIALIATEIERETDVGSLQGFDILFGQGLLFAPPRPVKPELLETTSDAVRPQSRARA